MTNTEIAKEIITKVTQRTVSCDRNGCVDSREDFKNMVNIAKGCIDKIRPEKNIIMEFKEGDEVWDAVLSPGISGKVVDANDDNKRPVYVIFNPTGKSEDMFSRNYTLDGRAIEGGIPTLCHQNYFVEFKKEYRGYEDTSI